MLPPGDPGGHRKCPKLPTGCRDVVEKLLQELRLGRKLTIWAQVCPKSAMADQNWPKLVQKWAIWAKRWSSLVNVGQELGPIRAVLVGVGLRAGLTRPFGRPPSNKTPGAGPQTLPTSIPDHNAMATLKAIQAVYHDIQPPSDHMLR